MVCDKQSNHEYNSAYKDNKSKRYSSSKDYQHVGMLQGDVGARQRKPSDFSEEYVGKHVVLKMSDGSTIEGILLEARRYWFKVKGFDAGIIYVSKGFVKTVRTV